MENQKPKDNYNPDWLRKPRSARMRNPYSKRDEVAALKRAEERERRRLEREERRRDWRQDFDCLFLYDPHTVALPWYDAEGVVEEIPYGEDLNFLPIFPMPWPYPF